MQALFESLAAFKQLCLPLWLLITALFGLTIGSFLNVVICRLPVMIERSQQAEARSCLGLPAESASRFDLQMPASSCPGCGQGIRLRNNIPLLSGLLLRGRAACCGEKISVIYPLVEGLVMLLFITLSWLMVPDWSWLGALLFFSALLTLALIDLRCGLLPDVLTLPLLWFGLTFNILQEQSSLQDAVIGAMAGYLLLWTVFHLFKLLSGKEGIGYGDFKFLAALGAWLGWQNLPALILIAASTALFIALCVALSNPVKSTNKRRRQVEIAFGPYLAFAAAALMFQHLITSI